MGVFGKYGGSCLKQGCCNTHDRILDYAKDKLQRQSVGQSVHMD